MARFDAGLLDLIAAAGPPVTVRQTYYMAVGSGLLPDKSERGYRKVIRHLGTLRESGALPWHYIADNTRWVRRPSMWRDLATALDDWHALYRRDYWHHQPKRLELWVESDSIASFVADIAAEFGVPLYVTKGQASKTYMHGAAEDARALGKPLEILYVGDFDPSGLQIERSVAERYARYADIDLRLQRVAVTAAQIAAGDLIATVAKGSDANYRRFVDHCHAHGVPVAAVETEALPPADLRTMVTDAIAIRLDYDAWSLAEHYERSERAQLADLLDAAGGDV